MLHPGEVKKKTNKVTRVGFIWPRNLKCSCENEKQTSGVHNDIRNTKLNNTVKGAD